MAGLIFRVGGSISEFAARLRASDSSDKAIIPDVAVPGGVSVLNFPPTPYPAVIADSFNLDAFSRLRVSTPTILFDSTSEYDLSPLKFEPITSSGSITHDAADSNALLSISNATGLAALQSYRWVRYQPLKSQLVAMTFTMGAAVANVTRRAGLFSATNVGATVTPQNGVYLEQNGATVNICLRNSGTQADQTIPQANWNLDTLGAGALNPSGLTLDLSKSQIFLIDFQWLGVGRIRVGFDIGGTVVYVHQFLNANATTDVYAKTMSLPIRYEITTSANASADMKAMCSAVISEGGNETPSGYSFVTEFTGTAGNGTRVHFGSIRPFLTFNALQVRYPLLLTSIEVIVTGNTPVLFETVHGATFSAGPTWAGAAFSPYSGAEVTTAAGTIATSPIISEATYCPSSAQSKVTVTREVQDLYPLRLDAAGANYPLGTTSFYATGLGATSACRILVKWKEVR